MMPDSMGGDLYSIPEPARTWPERLIGAGLAIASVLLLCCLLTYHPEQVSWALLNPAGHDKAAEVSCTNLLGVCGMYIAGLLYYLLGIVAVYGTLLLLVPACGMMMNPTARRRGQWIALLLMLTTACAVMSVQSHFFVTWAKNMQVPTPGGKLGYVEGPCIAEALLGSMWALALLLLVHGIALIYFARLTPKEIYHTEKQDIEDNWRRWTEKRRMAREEREAAARAWQSLPPEPEKSIYTGNLPLNLPDDTRYAPQPDDTRYAPRQENRPAPPRGYVDEAPRYAPEPRPLPPRRTEPMHSPEPPRRMPEPPQPPREERYIPPPRAPEPRPVPVVKEPPAPIAPRAAESARRTIRLGQPGNLLDLMAGVEEEIVRQNSIDPDDDGGYMHINQHTLDALDRLNSATKPTPAREPEQEPIAPASVPRRAPMAAGAAQPPADAPRRTEAPAPSTPEPEDTTDYPMPPYELLNYEPPSQALREAAEAEMQNTQALIADTLEAFRISVQPGDITRGPSITRYEFAVLRGQSVKSVLAKKNDLMAATSSESVNILAPIPGKSTVGIELQNSVSEPVYLRELLQSDEFHNPKMRLPVALGKDVYGKPVIGDLASMPHVLVAGTTGSGKSVCINSMLISLLYKFRPDQLKLVLVDPKQVEMQPYKKLPHLAVPVVTDPARVIAALRWAVNEMEHRYKLFSKIGVRNLEDFNKLPPEAKIIQEEKSSPQEDYDEFDMRDADAIVRDIEDSQGIEDIPEEDEQGELDFQDDGTIPTFLPYVVIVVDELADLMLQVKEDLELYIGRLTQKARAAGIHMVVATQTPRSQVVTGTIKTNLPCRIALKVSSQTDSRVILDEGGAENLLGRGDLLFLPPGGPSKMTRAQGAFVSDEEIASIIRFCAAHAKQNFVQSATNEISADTSQQGGAKGGRGGDASGIDEELYQRCVACVVTERKASTTLLQRRFRIGYARAAEIMELLEKRGVVAPSTGTSKPREVLID